MIVLFFSPAIVLAAEIMFEGYYRIELEGKPVGYTIQRYEFDPASKTFQVVSFLRAKFGDKLVQESLKGKSTDKFKPVSYQYTSQVGSDTKMIDATFKDEVMKLSINDGKKVRQETHKVPKGTFLSSFLPYLMLQRKLELNQVFRYSGVAEEDGSSYWGKAWLQSKEPRTGYEVYKILNTFKGEQFVSQMAVVKDPKDATKNIKGEVLGTSSPVKNLTSQLVTSPAQATEGQMVPNKILTSLFGGMPLGKVNLLAAPPPEVK